MTALRRVGRFWDGFLFATHDARPIALLRIAVGLVIAMQMTERLSVARSGFSNEGYLRREALSMFLSDFQLSIYRVFDDPWQVELGLIVTIVCALLFAVGWWARAAGPLTFVLLVSLHHRNSIAMYGADMLPRYFLFYLLWMRSDEAFSVASLRRRLSAARQAVRAGRDPRSAGARAPRIPVWPVRLFQIQVFFIYLFTGINKYYGTDYHEGTALWYALANPTYSRFYPEALPLFAAMYPLLQGLTIATLYWELAFPWMILFRRLRPVALGTGLLVHGGIGVLLSIGWWGQLMLVSYLAFLTGRPFRWIGVRYAREKRAMVPRAERLRIEYDPGDPAAVELVARVAVADTARLIRLAPASRPLRLYLGTRPLDVGEAGARLRRSLPFWTWPLIGGRAQEPPRAATPSPGSE